MARAFPDTRAALERMRAGNAAGCATVAALWGMFSAEALAAENPTMMCRIAERDGGAPVALRTPYRCPVLQVGDDNAYERDGLVL